MGIRGLIGRQVLNRMGGGKIQRPGRIQALRRLPMLMRLGLALLRDNRIPAWQRATVVALLALVFTPIDVVNAIPVVGQFWDFTLAVVILDGFIQFAPAHVVNEHIVALGLQKKIPLREL
ncbi:MAG: hypothetical protein NVS2B16_25400 [Chloroflexota bacterium]